MKLNSILFYVKFGNKNLWRRKSRTLLLGCSFMLLTLIMVLFLGYGKGVTQQMTGKVITNFLGDAAICSKNSIMDALSYEKIKSFSFSDLIRDSKKEDDFEFRKQYRTMSFLYTDNLQKVAMLIGIEDKSLDKISIIEGTNLDIRNGFNEVLLTSSLAENLRAAVGDRIAIEVVTATGMRNFDYFFVKGIYKIKGVAEIFNGHIAYASLGNVQRLLNETENKVTEVIVYKKNRSNIGSLKKLLANNINLKSYKVIPYQKFGNIIIGILGMFIIMVWAIGGIVFFTIGVFFFDTMLATIEERKKEYGTMMSMGLNKAQIGGLILSEFAVFSIYFIFVGVVLGGTIVKILERTGIPVFSSAFQTFMGEENIFSPSIDVGSLAILFIISFLLIELASLYSVIRINRLNVVEVLKND
ncbi:MAG: FtsX-like permease family protein [Firmicutes bacterium]|nr:FtsX-like permease family protein [Bacillota bacterium]